MKGAKSKDDIMEFLFVLGLMGNSGQSYIGSVIGIATQIICVFVIKQSIYCGFLCKCNKLTGKFWENTQLHHSRDDIYICIKLITINFVLFHKEQ